MYKLDGKAALITGAASGIGRAIALRLAQEGCDVAIVDIDRQGAEETAALVKREGRRSSVSIADVGDFAQVTAAVDATLGALGKIDLLYNNAGVVRVGTIAETSLDDWRLCYRINVDGVFHGCKAVVPHMIERGFGRIVNTASWFGKIGKASYGAYCSSKFAVIGLTQTLAAELAPHRINVNAVCPGTIVETRMRDEADRKSIEQGLATAKQRESTIPLGRVGLPQDIARVAVFLASEESSYMTGQAINVTGGLWMH
jgi:NAD(P)-dependent dehydrogenase (short-subunit alcohol dehydrogenase family)